MRDKMLKLAEELFSLEWFNGTIGPGGSWTVEVGGTDADGVTCDFAGSGDTLDAAERDLLRHLENYKEEVE